MISLITYLSDLSEIVTRSSKCIVWEKKLSLQTAACVALASKNAAPVRCHYFKTSPEKTNSPRMRANAQTPSVSVDGGFPSLFRILSLSLFFFILLGTILFLFFFLSSFIRCVLLSQFEKSFCQDRWPRPQSGCSEDGRKFFLKKERGHWRLNLVRKGVVHFIGRAVYPVNDS